jgi:hypothetical protein
VISQKNKNEKKRIYRENSRQHSFVEFRAVIEQF